MTFLTTHYQLERELTSKDLENLDRLYTVYGIRRLSIDGPVLMVEYDASRLHEAEVLAKVRGIGVAADPKKPIPEGSFDYTGEFRDFAWPTQGLSPANDKGQR
jgi:hypothetical protein